MKGAAGVVYLSIRITALVRYAYGWYCNGNVVCECVCEWVGAALRECSKSLVVMVRVMCMDNVCNV